MLKNQLMTDLKEAMQSKDLIRKNCIQLIRAKILQVEKDKQCELDDNSILEIISKDIKEKKNVIPEFEKGNRQDLIDKTLLEINVLEKYMPKQLTREEVINIVFELKESLDVCNMGNLIKAAKTKIGAQSDGKTIAEVVKEVLNGNS